MPINPFKAKEKPLNPPIESGQEDHNKRKEKENLNQIIHLTEPEYVFGINLRAVLFLREKI